MDSTLRHIESGLSFRFYCVTYTGVKGPNETQNQLRRAGRVRPQWSVQVISQTDRKAARCQPHRLVTFAVQRECVSSVNILAMPNALNLDDAGGLEKLVNDPIISDANPIRVL